MNNLKRLLDKLKAPNTNWKCILIVVVLATVVGGGIFGYSWWVGKQEVKLPEVKIQQKVMPEGVPEDETANWKVYRNEKYGFEIKYPSEWDYLTLGDYPSRAPVVVIFGHSRFFGEVEGQKAVETTHESLIYLGIQPRSKPIYERLLEIDVREILNQADVTVSGRKGKFIELGEPGFPDLHPILYAWWEKGPEDPYVYELRGRDVSYYFPQEDKEENIRNIFQQMLSTFQFIK